MSDKSHAGPQWVASIASALVGSALVAAGLVVIVAGELGSSVGPSGSWTTRLFGGGLAALGALALVAAVGFVISIFRRRRQGTDVSEPEP